ncbi:hypothetical protein E3P86_00595 [Wallemia ichthyophaga]|uniref:MI domain-containing protein n=1 Tax=Wallemia ichthyophaga TaxID=245174 RepID=A0A4T0JH86_WALIC|nr:hypothetical protein E3P86_00595 [Wallemia ichthyophaga]
MAITKSGKSAKSGKFANKTTQLPQNLVAEIDDKYGTKTPSRKLRTRKETRKEIRSNKKQSHKGAPPVVKKQLDPNDARTQGREKAYQQPIKEADSSKSDSSKKDTNKSKAIEQLVDPSKKSKKTKSNPEDDEIAWLEYQLKNKKSDDIKDDLDDLLDDVNGIEGRLFDDQQEHNEQVDDEEMMIDDNLNQGDPSESEASEESEESEEDDEDAGSSKDEEGDTALDETMDEAINDTNTQTQTQTHEPSSQPAKYIPPAVRAARERKLQESQSVNVQKSEELQKINKIVKGSLNRLSEANIESILQQLLDLYRTKPRHDVTSSIVDLVLSTIGSRDNMLDSFVILYAGFISALHRLVGVEFIAHLTQTTITKLDANPLSHSTEGGARQNLNLISMLSELYNLGSLSNALIYDLIRALISTDRLNEAQIDAVLRIVRSAGQQLRHDDPGSLKEIVLAVQNKVDSINKEELGSRFKFMLECLNNLKNNKIKNLPGAQGGSESRDRIKRYIKNIDKRPGVSTTEALTVSLIDLRQADSKGKWWLVGSAWSGNPLVDKKEDFAKNKGGDDALVKLAKKQGMNTDVRRSIFIILMSSEDYIDACDRLGGLGLSEVQQREIVRVIVHCAGNEKRYNPYYTMVASHLLSQSHSTRITLQYVMWDFLRELGEAGVGGSEILKNGATGGDGSTVRTSRIDNLAKSLAWWVAKSSVPLSIFKPVIFPTLTPKAREFFNKFFVYLFLSIQSSSPTLNLDSKRGDKSVIDGIMMKAAPISNLANGLKWFLSHMDLGDLNKRELDIVDWCVMSSNDALKLGMSLSE